MLIEHPEEGDCWTPTERSILSANYNDELQHKRFRNDLVSEKTWGEVSKQLRAYFPAEVVKWVASNGVKQKKNGSGWTCKPAAYIDARDIRERLVQVVGEGNWQVNYEEMTRGIKCTIAIHCENTWLERSDAAGWAENKSGKEDNTLKTTITNSFKRAGMAWGIGEYLYGFGDLWSPQVDDEAHWGEPGWWNAGKHWFKSPVIPDHFLPLCERTGIDPEEIAKVEEQLKVISESDLGRQEKMKTIEEMVKAIKGDMSLSLGTREKARLLCGSTFKLIRSQKEEESA